MDKTITDVVRTAYVNDVTVTSKDIQDSFREEGRKVSRQTISRILRKCRQMERGYRLEGIIGDSKTEPVLRASGKEGLLTFPEKVLLSASITVGIATIISVIWK